MKKTYMSPAIETTEVNFASLICEGSPLTGSSMYGGGSGGGSGINPAPGKKPF